jgi:hypothetical protein
MKITAAICVAVSLWSVVNVYLDGAGAAILAKQHASEAYADKTGNRRAGSGSGSPERSGGSGGQEPRLRPGLAGD